MAKRHACWVIVVGTSPTAFRARDAEDLLPTLRQLQRTQPDTVMKWFDRGRLWASPLEADEALKAQRQAPKTRGREWRPGGEHVDPRAKYQLSRDAKRARFKQRAIRERMGGVSPKPDGDKGSAPPPAKPSPWSRPQGDRSPKQGSSAWTPRPPGDRSRKPGPPSWGRAPDDRSRKPGPSSWTRQPGDRPQGDRSRKPGPSGWTRPPGDRPQGDRSRKPGPSGWTRPPGDRPQGDRSRKSGPSGWTRPPGDGSRKPGPFSSTRPPGNRRPDNRFRPKQNTRGRKPK